MEICCGRTKLGTYLTVLLAWLSGILYVFVSSWMISKEYLNDNRVPSLVPKNSQWSVIPVLEMSWGYCWFLMGLVLIIGVKAQLPGFHVCFIPACILDLLNRLFLCVFCGIMANPWQQYITNNIEEQTRVDVDSEDNSVTNPAVLGQKAAKMLWIIVGVNAVLFVLTLWGLLCVIVDRRDIITLRQTPEFRKKLLANLKYTTVNVDDEEAELDRQISQKQNEEN